MDNVPVLAAFLGVLVGWAATTVSIRISDHRAEMRRMKEEFDKHHKEVSARIQQGARRMTR